MSGTECGHGADCPYPGGARFWGMGLSDADRDVHPLGSGWSMIVDEEVAGVIAYVLTGREDMVLGGLRARAEHR